jgi:adenylate kinase
MANKSSPTSLSPDDLEPSGERRATPAEDLEVKDAQLIFNSVWTDLVQELGETNLRFPREISWLNGAPGSGKGTHTRFIMSFRGLSADPIAVSDLLVSEEAVRRKDAGILVGDREVTYLVFKALLNSAEKGGVLVDGYPRTKVQVECLKLLYNKIIELRQKFLNTLYAPHFPKPHFHIIVLFIDEQESVHRQLLRGKQIMEHNQEVDHSGMGEKQEVRKTDTNEADAARRYKTFKEITYEALKSLREVFQYHFINAHGSVSEVRKRIEDELRYQSALELDEATHDRLASLPIASQIAGQARLELVQRLDSYEENHSDLFARVVKIIERDFMPIVVRHAISGMSYINTNDDVFESPLALAILIDIFSERGFHAVVDVRKELVPVRVDPRTFEIKSEVRRLYRVRINFPAAEIRYHR